MEAFSSTVGAKDILLQPINFKRDPYLSDHRFQDKVVYPAVETVELLAACTKSHWPRVDVTVMAAVRFHRFIAPHDPMTVAAFCRMSVPEAGGIVSELITQRRSKTGITRTLRHASVCFQCPLESGPPLPIDVATCLEGVFLKIPSKRIYPELVPFGPAYHNVGDPFFLSENGALAEVRGGDVPHGEEVLGSPFPLDAAFHAASVWTQRYQGFVGFPVGFSSRKIHYPTRHRENYVCRIIPLEQKGVASFFDLWIYDRKGRLKEEVRGLKMRDVTGGRIKPPDWIRSLSAREGPEW